MSLVKLSVHCLQKGKLQKKTFCKNNKLVSAIAIGVAKRYALIGYWMVPKHFIQALYLLQNKYGYTDNV